MGLNEDAVDLFEVHDAGLVADGFNERTQAQIAGAVQEALAGGDDQGQRFRGESVVAQAGAVEPISNSSIRIPLWVVCRIIAPPPNVPSRQEKRPISDPGAKWSRN